MRERHNDEYYTVEDQRFLGEEGFGKAISREAGIIVRGRQEIGSNYETDAQIALRSLLPPPATLGSKRRPGG
jgi:hypothetical protein